MGLTLYHHGASTCSVKVRLALAEKGQDFESEHIDLLKGEQHDPEYVKLNPNHVVPTLVHDGRVLVESGLIIQYIDETYSGVSLTPDDPFARHQMRLWMKRIDELHPNAGVLTYAIGPRNLIIQLPEAEREAAIQAIPDPVKRQNRRDVIELGVKAPQFRGALAAFIAFLDQMESALVDREWLAGSEFSLADIAAAPYVIRSNDVGLTPLFSGGARPRLQSWFERLQARPSFETAVTKWVPPALLEMLSKNAAELWPDIETLIREIEG